MNWKQTLGLLISLAFLALVILNRDLGVLWEGISQGDFGKILNPEISPHRLAEVFAQVHYPYLLIATAICLFLFAIRAVRWHYLLLPNARIAFAPLFSATMIGFMANNVLPVRAGEFVRAYVLSKKRLLPIGLTLATLAVERLFDMLCLLLMFILTFHLSPHPSWVTNVGIAATLITIIFITFLLSAILVPSRFTALLTLGSRFLPQHAREKSVGFLASFVVGLGALRHAKSILIIFLLSIFHWFLFGVAVGIGLRSFHISVPAEGPYFILSVVSLGLVIPSSPGFVGTYQWFMEKGLSVYSVPKYLSFPFSVGFHLVLYVPTTVIGLAYFFRENLSWSEVRKNERR